VICKAWHWRKVEDVEDLQKQVYSSNSVAGDILLMKERFVVTYRYTDLQETQQP
jgi:hypothetical protein